MGRSPAGPLRRRQRAPAKLPPPGGRPNFARLIAVGVVAAALQGCAARHQDTAAPARDSSAAAVETGAGATPPVNVQTAQRALVDLGYYEAPVDGMTGPRTHAAVAAFQKNAELPVTGELSAELVDRLQHAAAEHRRRIASFRGSARPVYQIGDRFFYSDGSFETVLSIDGPRVVWQGSDGSRRSAPWNFILPPFTWWSERSTGSATADAAFDTLWPLAAGGQARFSTTMSTMENDPHARETVETWFCRVGVEERLSVPAGEFQTIPVTCRAQPQPSGSERTVVWNYAPAVGHFIRRLEYRPDERERSHESRLELVAVDIGGTDWPAAARAGLDWAFQHALENEPPGRDIEWESTAVADRVTIEPLAATSYAGEKKCRRFAETRLDPDGMKQVYPGIACRDLEGRWTIPQMSHQTRAERLP
jgi:peptidoglycan hydrolase-like protein with peptidoglycan-binding domain/surface antigen